MLNKRITLKEFHNLLTSYVTKYGDRELITIGVTSDHNYMIMIGENDALWENISKLPIPQYKDDYNQKINDFINFNFGENVK